MRLEPLYTLRFTYPEEWRIGLGEPDSKESQWFFFSEGRCDGRISGAFRGANHPRQRSDGTFQPNFQGIIETDDDATIYVDIGGYGRAYPAGRRQIVGYSLHLSHDARYRWLNDTVCASTGEVRALESGDTELVLETAELIWEPLEGR
jgi:hypothetical protein